MTAPARYWSEAQALSRAAPTLDTEGMPMFGLRGFRCCIFADVGQTLSGAGFVDFYIYNPDVGLWMINPGLTQTVTATTVRAQAIPDFELGADMFLNHRVLAAARAVTVSSGAVTLRIDGAAQ